MKINPVYRQESRVSARSFRLPLIILSCNSLLALVALLNMYSMVTQVKATAEIQYSSFLSLYIFGAAIEFAMLLLIVPALTAGSVSGERERQTLCRLEEGLAKNRTEKAQERRAELQDRLRQIEEALCAVLRKHK